MINNLVVISDTHVGCQLGLCCPKIKLSDGGTYLFSPFQEKIWNKWLEFWNEWVPIVTRGEPYGVVINGDLMDGRHHNSTTQISQNLADQEHIASEIFYPIAEKCALTESGERCLFITRGTPVHTGESAENEERLAERIKPHKDASGNNSAYEWWIRIGTGKTALCNFNHHIGTTGRAHYESSALMAELSDAYVEAGRWNGIPPDIVVRSHRHRFCEVKISSAGGDGIVVVTPGWQLKTPFVWKIPGGRNSNPQIGGIILRAGNEEHFTRHRVWNIERSPEVVI